MAGITLNQIHAIIQGEEWLNILKAQGKDQADDDLFPIVSLVYEVNINTALKCLPALQPTHDNLIKIRKFLLVYVRHFDHLCPVAGICLDVVARYLEGTASLAELKTANYLMGTEAPEELEWLTHLVLGTAKSAEVKDYAYQFLTKLVNRASFKEQEAMALRYSFLHTFGPTLLPTDSTRTKCL